MKYTIDKGAPHTNIAIGICDCGARFLAMNADDARERLAMHERNVHPDDRDARPAARRQRKKAR